MKDSDMLDDEYGEDIFYKKRELIVSFEDILSLSEIEVLKASPGLTIGEIAGKDSVAAIIKTSEREDIHSILPVVIYTGTLYGDWGIVSETVKYIRKEIKKRYKKEVHNIACLGSPKLWHAVNGRYLKVLSERFGFSSPCIACHLYIHSMVIPLAKRLNVSLIIAGERESHHGERKINQTPIAIDASLSMLKEFGIELVLPLRYIRDDKEVVSIIGREWSDEDQLACVLEGNYNPLNGTVQYEESLSYKYFHYYAFPGLKRIIKGILEGKRLDYTREMGRELGVGS
ncbi:MAG: hypothetical protein HY999_00820 [Nitrospinae bacterium]|nr:hypothetical protein [Nitrospinota bacterium]